jgi:probable F420-dependent oxidoreductase
MGPRDDQHEEPGPANLPAFRFAVQVKNVLDGGEWRDRAQAVEALGYSTLVMSDHPGHHLAVLPALTAAAAATTTLRVSPLVLANDFRHPVMLAKEAATVDALSSGRFDLALGTGWYPPDYHMLGMPIERPGVRVGRLAESVVLVKRLMTEEEVDHYGRWFQVRRATIVPRPVQQPHPPIMIGGQGPKMLQLAGREADIVSIMSPATASDMAGKLATVREAAGSRLGSLQLHATADIAIVDDPAASYEAAAADHNMTPTEAAESPSFLYGPLDALRDKLLANRARFGITYYAVGQDLMESFAPLARDLMPAAT